METTLRKYHHLLPTSLHLVTREVEGQWVVSCLDFDLAAQDDTFEGAQKRVVDQVNSYVAEALYMDGGAYAEQLLTRRAPRREWILFKVGRLLQALRAARALPRGYQRPFQFQPQTA